MRRVRLRSQSRTRRHARRRDANHQRARRFLDQRHRDGFGVRARRERHADRVGKARRLQHEGRVTGTRRREFHLRRARRRARAGGKRRAHHQRRGGFFFRRVSGFPPSLARRRDAGKASGEGFLRGVYFFCLRLLCERRGWRTPGRLGLFRVNRPLAVPRRARAHFRGGVRAAAVLERHALYLPFDFRLLRLALLGSRGRAPARGRDLLAVEVPQRHREPRLGRREHLVRHARVGLEQHEPTAQRRDVRQTHGLLLLRLGFFVAFFVVAPAERDDVPHALGDVHRARERDIGRGSTVARVALVPRSRHRGAEAVGGGETPPVAVGERRGVGAVGAQTPEHPELASVALLPVRVEVQERGEQAPVPVGVVHVPHVARARAGVHRAHRLRARRDVARVAAQLAQLVHQRVRALHGVRQAAPQRVAAVSVRGL